MILGFISLLLTIGTRAVATICIPAELGSTMLPCKVANVIIIRNAKPDTAAATRVTAEEIAGESCFHMPKMCCFSSVLAAPAGGETFSKPVSHITGQCSHHPDFYCIDSTFNFF